jgi:hypothetical protein
MKPAVCLLCGKTAIEEIGASRGDWVQFAEYVETSADSLDHPKGLEYFCDEHLASAQPLASKLSQEALADLQRQFGTTFAHHPTKAGQPQSWWRRLIGGKK